MKVLVTGAGGQLGREVLRARPKNAECVALARAELDISDAAAVAETVGRIAPEAIINAAAYTAVDRAESEKALALAVNRDGARHLAEAAKDRGARLIHVSTDFIFDGERTDPYPETAEGNPKSAYGSSKWQGELAIREVLGAARVVVRSSWLYSAFGQNFVKTMLRLMAERDALRVVSDQVGTPTWAAGLATGLWDLAQRPEIGGDLHWSDDGAASWYDFAVAIQEEAIGIGLLERAIPIAPVTTAEYGSPAPRPAYSVLDKTETWRRLGYRSPPWRENLLKMLRDLKNMEMGRDG